MQPTRRLIAAAADVPVVATPAPRSSAGVTPMPASGLPSRWRAGFAPYEWQQSAAAAWEENGGHGIMEVVTGAGKTALAIYLFARLLDRAEAVGEDLQAIVVVPRIELARQWAREFRCILDISGLRIGEYHSQHRCTPTRQDVLIVTQDSARRLIPRLRLDRPVLLIADECHRLGAPAASRVLARDFTWTLGLSATPERGGDLAFEQVLIPRLGPVVWKYGYREAVRDGIIARFSVARMKVSFTEREAQQYAERSERITRLLGDLKAAYPALRRAAGGRFWQIMGDLKRRHPEDERFEILTATATERRSVVHFAERKYEAVREIAASGWPPPQGSLFS